MRVKQLVKNFADTSMRTTRTILVQRMQSAGRN